MLESLRDPGKRQILARRLGAGPEIPFIKKKKKKSPGENEAAGPGNTLSKVWTGTRDPISARAGPA